MREFDENGLLLASFQGKLFEETVSRGYSSTSFFKCFRTSLASTDLDNKNPLLIDLNVNYYLDEMGLEADDKDAIYSENAMYWLGYILRYICYTRECSTRFIYTLISPEELIKRYYVYHTQSEEWVIKEILEHKNVNEDFFDKNKRIKKRLLESNYLQHQ